MEQRSVQNDRDLVERIAAAYRYAEARFDGHGDSFWEEFNRDCGLLHDALMQDDVSGAGAVLRDPHNAPIHLFRGFCDLTRTVKNAEAAGDRDLRRRQEAEIAALIAALAEAVGAVRCTNPESAASTAHPALEDLLAALDDRLGFRVDFPNPYPGEIGLATSRGVAEHRSLHAIYQAWRIAQLAHSGASALEIGAGLGRTAYYATKLGLSYTIIDLPLTNVAQADFLGRALGPEKIVLSGETRSNSEIGIFGPEWFLASGNHFSVILNADSLTEMDPEHARRYFDKICDSCDVFLSINHEANRFCVTDLPGLVGRTVELERHRYWLRNGYVEELAHFGPNEQQGKEVERLRKTLMWQARKIDRLSRAPSNSRRELVKRFIDVTLGRF